MRIDGVPQFDCLRARGPGEIPVVSRVEDGARGIDDHPGSAGIQARLHNLADIAPLRSNPRHQQRHIADDIPSSRG